MKLLPLIIAFASFPSVWSQCTHCTDLSEALKNPSQVRSLDLSNRNLTAIPSEIAVFTELETLDLSNNLITNAGTGKIHLSSLYELNLSNNIGLDPLTLTEASSSFPGLMHLDLSGCKLPFLLPNLGNFKELIELDLSNNDLQFLPEEIRNLEVLQVLNLQNNQFKKLDYVLGNNWNLRKLNVAQNPLSLNGLVASLSFNDAIEHLSVTIESDRDIPKQLKELPLTSIELINCNIKNLPAPIRSHPTISALTLTNCTFTSDISSNLRLSKISDLELNHTALPAELSTVQGIDKLVLSDIDGLRAPDLLSLKTLDVLDIRGLAEDDNAFDALPEQMTKTKILSSSFNYTPEMVSNKVVPIVKEPMQEATVSSTKPQVLTLSGVRFDIPANAFLSENGSPYSGPVKMSVTNYDDPLTNALSGIPMIYAADGRKELFSSAGMIDIRVTDDKGNTLQPNPSNTIQVTFKNLQPGTDPNLYAFDQTTNSWTQLNTPPVQQSIDSLLKSRIDSLNKLDLASFVNFQTVSPFITLRSKNHRWDPSTITFKSYQKFMQRELQYSGNQIYWHNPSPNERLITSSVWKIDTIMTPKLKAILDTVRRAVHMSDRQLRNGGYNRLTCPIQELKVTPDFANDNYRMTFRYKDTLVSIPVFLETKGSTRSVMREHAKFQMKYERAIKKEQLSANRYERKKQAMINTIGAERRQMLLQRYMSRQISDIERSQLIFGLTAFGLVNCDYFSRNPPNSTLALAAKLVDQHGQSCNAPASVRVVVTADNVYLETSSEKIPFYRNSSTLIIMTFSDTEIGVIRIDEKQKEKIQEFTRISISGKSAAEVKQLITSV